jgi:hypothetical protein
MSQKKEEKRKKEKNLDNVNATDERFDDVRSYHQV